MSLIGSINRAMGGIQWASQLAERSAAGISRLAVDGDANLAQDAVNLKLAKHALAANVAVIKKADEMEEHLLDVIA